MSTLGHGPETTSNQGPETKLETNLETKLETKPLKQLSGWGAVCGEAPPHILAHDVDDDEGEHAEAEGSDEDEDEEVTEAPARDASSCRVSESFAQPEHAKQPICRTSSVA